MVKDVFMTDLNKWLKQNDTKVGDFAEIIGVSETSVYRYINGERTPKRDVMNRIFNSTNQQVTADSFYQ